MILLYNILLLLASPLLAVWLALRVLAGKLAGLSERLGAFRQPVAGGAGTRLWIHAVSLGEMKIATALAAELRKLIPDLAVIYTTSTNTGRQAARQSATPRDSVLCPPIDLGWVCRRFLRHIRPSAVIIVETELWPNLFSAIRKRGTPLIVVNGRISNRSWPRYRATRWFWRSVLGNVSHVYAASEADAARFRQIGASSGKLSVAGNFKFQAGAPGPEPAFLQSAKAQLKLAPSTKVIVAGSTMPGEETILLDAFRKLKKEFPTLWMIVAPRHPERFDEVAGALQAGGVACARRGNWKPGASIPIDGVMVLDTIGELAAVYQLCDVAFVGGSLVPRGGHNMLEPAACGKPTVVGPSMENFADVLVRFLEADAGVRIAGARVGSAVQVSNAEGLLAAFRQLLANPAQAELLGAGARRVVLQNQRSSGQAIQEIAQILLEHGAR